MHARNLLAEAMEKRLTLKNAKTKSGISNSNTRWAKSFNNRDLGDLAIYLNSNTDLSLFNFPHLTTSV